MRYGVLLFRASDCLLSQHVVVLGVSVVSGTSPNFTFSSEAGSGLNMFLNRDAFRRMECLSSAAVTGVPLISVIIMGLGQKGVNSLLDFLS